MQNETTTNTPARSDQLMKEKGLRGWKRVLEGLGFLLIITPSFGLRDDTFT